MPAQAPSSYRKTQARSMSIGAAPHVQSPSVMIAVPCRQYRVRAPASAAAPAGPSRTAVGFACRRTPRPAARPGRYSGDVVVWDGGNDMVGGVTTACDLTPGSPRVVI